jgi:phosphohistidine phosphatase
MAQPVLLYIVRHAIAEPRGSAWPDDSLRPLTDEGISRMRRIVAGLASLDVELDVVLTSPLKRARQTADLMAEGLASNPPVVEISALAPGTAANDVIAAISARRKHTRLAVVGHEPGLGKLAATLLGIRRALPFKKGGVCCLELAGLPPSSPATLLWFAPPRLLRRLR